MTPARAHATWCGASPGRFVCQCRAEIQTVDWLVELICIILPLAAAAQVGRCHCRRAIPPERTGWANPHCYTCMPEDRRDRLRRADYEANVKLIARGEKLDCACEPEGGFMREGPVICPRHEPAAYLLGYRGGTPDRRAPEPVVSSRSIDGDLRRRSERRGRGD